MKRFLKHAIGMALLTLAFVLAPAFLSGQLGLKTGTAYAIINISNPAGPLSDGAAHVGSAQVPASGYGVPAQGPITLPANPSQAQASFAQGQSAIVCYSSTQTPGAVNANTCAEQALTVTGVAAGSLVYVSNPTLTTLGFAGLGIAGARVSAANTVQVKFFNVTAGNLTPTATQAYLFVEIRGPLIQTQAVTPKAVAATSTSTQQFATVPAAGQQGLSSAQHGLTSGVTALNQNPPAITTLAPGAVPTPVNQIPVLLGTPQTVIGNKPTEQAGLAIHNWRIAGNNLLEVNYLNTSGAPITPTAETYSFFACRGMSLHGVVEYLVNVGTLGALTATDNTNYSLTVNGVVVGDRVAYIVKPSEQAHVGTYTGRVSAANTVIINVMDANAAAATPTGSEVWAIGIVKAFVARGAILTQFTAVFTPAQVAAVIGAEQTFALPNALGITPKANSFIAGFNVMAVGAGVNNGGLASTGFNGSAGSLGSPLPTGLVIGGVRISADNVLAIGFCNVTAAAIQPPALMITILLAPGDISGSAASAAGSGVVYGYDVQDQQQMETLVAIEQALIAQNWLMGS